MDCLTCRGACCEEVLVEVGAQLGKVEETAAREWFEVRGARALRGHYAFDCRCPHLTEEGLCGVQETSKPVMCVLYEAGGEDCLDVVYRRRDALEYARIRGPEDPKVHEVYSQEEVRQAVLARTPSSGKVKITRVFVDEELVYDSEEDAQ